MVARTGPPGKAELQREEAEPTVAGGGPGLGSGGSRPGPGWAASKFLSHFISLCPGFICKTNKNGVKTFAGPEIKFCFVTVTVK